MGVKYYVEYKDFEDNEWRVNISTDNYFGTPIEVRSEKSGVDIKYSPKVVDAVDSCIINSSADITLYNTDEYNINIDELQNAQDKDFRLEVIKNSNLFWSGYVIPDGISESLLSKPYTIKISARDGLTMLEDLPLYITNNPLPAPINNRSPLAIVRDILWYRLNIELPIYFTSTFIQRKDSTDGFAGTTPFSYRGEIFVDFNGEYRSCEFFLENILKSFRLQIIQISGRWVIRNVREFLKSNIEFKYIDINSPGVLFNFSTNHINEVKFIENTQSRRSLPPLGSFKTTYNAIIAENVLPNGNFEMEQIGLPIYWGFIDGPGSRGELDIVSSISSQGTNSVSIRYPNTGSPTQLDYIYFTLVDFDGNLTQKGINIDTEILYKTLNLGLTFSPISGFNLDANGFIKFNETPLAIEVRYVTKTNKEYFLNQFGFWVQPPPFFQPWASANYVGQGTSDSRRTVEIDIKGYPMERNLLVIKIVLTGGGTVNEYSRDFVVQSSEVGRRDLLAERVRSTFSSSSGIMDVQVNEIDSNTTRIWFKFFSGTAFVYDELNSVVKMSSGGDGFVHDKAIGIHVDGMRIGDIARIDFNAKQDIKTINEDGRLFYSVILTRGMSMIVDDISVNVDDANNDVYIASASTNSRQESEELEISSSYTSFQFSNYFDYFFNSPNWMNFEDEYGNIGTLTNLYSQAKMRQRYKSNKIIDCSLKIDNDFEIMSCFGFDAKRYLPINFNYNTNNNTLKNVVMAELVNDDISINVTHLNSNDRQLSN